MYYLLYYQVSIKKIIKSKVIQEKILEILLNKKLTYNHMKDIENYYVPEIEEFHVGFQYEFRSLKGWEERTFNSNDGGYYNNVSEMKENISEGIIRVKYLDREDVESLGFIDNHYDDINPKDSYFKIIEKDAYEIKVYWNMLRGERENMIRVFKGKIHNYPYTEVFRGTIKNKSELKRLLKQLGIL